MTKSNKPKSARDCVQELLIEVGVHARNAYVGNEELLHMMKECIHNDRPFPLHPRIATVTNITPVGAGAVSHRKRNIGNLLGNVFCIAE